MLTPTPNPTIQELRENAPLVNGDASLAVSEVVERLRDLLPDYIEDQNTLNNWTTDAEKIAVPARKDIEVAPLDVTQIKKNSIFVSFSVTTTPQGVGAFKNEVILKVWSIEGRASTSQQIKSHTRRIECVRAVLLHFLRGCVTADGKMAWRLLEPRGFELVGDRREYSGIVANYMLIQSPNMGIS